MKPFYFDPSRYKTYLEQLGVPYPPPVEGDRVAGSRSPESRN